MRVAEFGVAASLGLLAAAGCVPRPGPTAIVSNSGQQTPIEPSEVRVVAAPEAHAVGWIGRRVAHTFGADRDGTELVTALIAEAEQQGALAISDIVITLAVSKKEGATECRTSILPETISETHVTPATHRMVPVQRPVSRMVSEQQYRCHMESRPETRSVTEYEQRCRSVSRPVTRIRSTYSRSGPRTESYTSYESRQECRSEPVHRMRTQSVMKNVCRHETVHHQVTRYEYQLESRFVPPRLETLTHHRLREGAPICYALDPPAAAGPDGGAVEPAPPPPPPPPANRIEAIFYFPPVARSG